MRSHPDFAKIILKGVVQAYSYALSPLLGPNCRFHPTCSAYAVEAIDRHGALKGGFMAFRRLLKCHPWYKGPMLDPVPAAIDRAPRIGYKRAEQTKEEKDHAQS